MKKTAVLVGFGGIAKGTPKLSANEFAILAICERKKISSIMKTIKYYFNF